MLYSDLSVTTRPLFHTHTHTHTPPLTLSLYTYIERPRALDTAPIPCNVCFGISTSICIQTYTSCPRLPSCLFPTLLALFPCLKLSLVSVIWELAYSASTFACILTVFGVYTCTNERPHRYHLNGNRVLN